jgi:tRNA pseudouridine55 synthase
VKVEGKRLHREARRGNPVQAPARTITVHELVLTRYAWPELDLTLRCSSGTYARSIARDLGEILGTGGYMSRLVRRSVGALDLSMAHAPDTVQIGDLVGIESALKAFPRLNVPLEQRHLLARGQTLRTPPGFPVQEPCFAWVNGEVVSAITFVNGGTHFRTKRLLV